MIADRTSGAAFVGHVVSQNNKDSRVAVTSDFDFFSSVLLHINGGFAFQF